ncbi:MAG: RHS repeat-associated core domain-containing protein [Anaerolineae bacterium]|nr:hypothetical protein [Candidatus Roseilinea sp.]MDW8449798.1 RHS repeat-associated core domain-containing protein [Anaerolineae bacterium]
MYSPLLARFLSPDSIVPRPDDPQSFNRYAYVLNNPLRYTDPTGHFWKEAAILLGGAVAGAFIGLAGETSSQVFGQALAVAKGDKSVQQAIKDYHSSESEASRIGAAAGGAITGFTIAIPQARGKHAGPAWVAAASIAGGQVEALVGGIAEERLRHGEQFNVGNAGLRAVKRGWGDFGTMVKDAGLGVAAGLASDIVKSQIDRIAGRSFRTEIKQITDFDPVTKRPNITSLGKSNVVRLNPLQQVLVEGLKTGWDVLAEIGVRNAP